MSPELTGSRRLRTVTGGKVWRNNYPPYDDIGGGGGGGGGGTLQMLIGNAQGGGEFDAFQADVSNPTGSKVGGTNTGFSVRRSYNTASTPPASFNASAAGGDPGRGVASYLSWTPPASWPTTMLTSGSQQNAIANLAASWPVDHEGFFTIAHEPEDNGYNQADFRAMQALCHEIWHNNIWDSTKVLFGPLLTADGFKNGGGPHFFPGGGTLATIDYSAFDFTGVDFYSYFRDPTAPLDVALNSRGNKQPGSYYGTDPIQLANGKPLVIGEHGIHPDPANPTDRPTRLQAYMDYWEANGAICFCLFHSNAGAHGPWWFDSYRNWHWENGCTWSNGGTVINASASVFATADIGAEVSAAKIGGVAPWADNTIITSRPSATQIVVNKAANAGASNVQLGLSHTDDHTTFRDDDTMAKIRDILAAHVRYTP